MGGKAAKGAATPTYTGIQLQTSAEGLCIPIVWGRNRVAPNLIWTGNFQQHKGGGGKGGGKGKGGGGKSGGKGGASTTYSAGIILAICEGPIEGMGVVYKDGAITSLGNLGLTLYLGTAAQGATPFSDGGGSIGDQIVAATLALFLGGTIGSPITGNLGYPSTAYVASMDYDLGSAPTLPQHNFEVSSAPSGEIAGTPDVDPADVIRDMLTSPQYGLGFPGGAIGDTTDYSNYCRAMGLLFSPVLQQQEQAISILQRWAQITNSWIFWSENKIKFVPLGDQAISRTAVGPIAGSGLHSGGSGYAVDDTGTVTGGSGDATWIVRTINTDSTLGPVGAVMDYVLTFDGTSYVAANNVTMAGGLGSGFAIDVFVPGSASFTPDLTPIYDLTYEDFATSGTEPPVTVTRSDPADGFNWVKVSISDRGKSYNSATIEYKDQNSIELYGLLQSNDVQATEICERSVGATVASILGKRAVYIRNTYAFKLSYNFVLLEPGDIVTLTDPEVGLVKFPVRIQTMAEDEAGLLTFVAEECPQGIGTPAAATSQGWLGTAPPAIDVAPGSVNAPAIIEPPASVTLGTAQIWIGLSSSSGTWGGAQVHVSLDDVTYIDVGTIQGGSPQGVLLAALPTHVDPDTTDTLSVDLSESRQILSSSVTHADADAARSVALVEGELVAGGAIIPNAHNSFSFDISYLRRGVYGTPIAAHAIGAPFCAILPGSMLKVPLPQAYVGQTIYLKFPSFNIYGAGLQDISTVTRYTYVPTGVVFTIAPPTSPVLTVTTPTGAIAIAMTLAWTASLGPALGSYEVEFSIDGGTTWNLTDVVVGANATSYTLAPVIANTDIMARVRARSGDGQAASSWATSAVVNSGPAVIAPLSVIMLPLVNGDVPVGIVADQFGVPVYVVT
jgi:hypothetical protein